MSRSSKPGSAGLSVEDVLRRSSKRQPWGEIWDREFWLLAAAALLASVVRGMLAARLELFQDEALYHFIGTRLPWTFAPHPPATPLLARLGTALLGRTELGVRLANVILGGLTIFPLYFFAKRMLGSRGAYLAGLGYLAIPIYFGFGTICTPDMPQLFVWCVLLYATWRALEENSDRWWIVAGVVLGLGLYVKYILVLYVPALLLYAAWSGLWRRLMGSRGFWVGMGLAFLIFVPVLLWQEASHDWPALRYHLRDRQRWTPSSATSLLVYLGIHAAYYSPLLYGAMVWGLAAAWWAGRRQRDWRAGFLASFGLVPLVFFLIVASATRRELSREQWDAPAYVCGLVAASWWVQRLMRQAQSSRAHRWMRGLVVAALVMGFVTQVLVAVEGLTTWPSRWLGRMPLFRTMIGWRSLARYVDDLAGSEPATSRTIVLGNSFVPAIQYAFYGQRDLPVYTLDHRQNAKFGLRELIERAGLSLRGLGERGRVDAIFVADGEPMDDATRKLAGHRERLSAYFERVEALPSLDVRLADRVVERFYVLRCRGFYAADRPESRPDDEAEK